MINGPLMVLPILSIEKKFLMIKTKFDFAHITVMWCSTALCVFATGWKFQPSHTWSATCGMRSSQVCGKHVVWYNERPEVCLRYSGRRKNRRRQPPPLPPTQSTVGSGLTTKALIPQANQPVNLISDKQLRSACGGFRVVRFKSLDKNNDSYFCPLLRHCC